MNIDTLLSMSLPCEVFSTFHRFENYYVDDMQCGDLVDRDFQLLGLEDISARVDPFRCLQFNANNFYSPRVADFGLRKPQGVSLSHQRCAEIMFDEMIELSTQFAHGPYAPLIGELINHFHYGNGGSWHSERLSRAYAEVIRGTETNHLLHYIQTEINERFYLKQQIEIDFNFLTALSGHITRNVRLPKFNRFIDRFNGLGISVHDIYAQKVSLESFHRNAVSWEGVLLFTGQDHFGLGTEDITNDFYKNFRFFRIWFFLQRHRDYAFKPFMTNFRAYIHINGGV
ncbi:TPA: DUF3289 family protein [Enterobacter hormaechei subsp. steigerwaltii]|uniref:DUF3289 family protein n=1 Tax=Enterobacter hormaechei TaxID=158836 RepID=UPI0018C2453D|nr:DUF3289 family protein [Enterobacter hormaechei]MBF9844850.1 DUF3289 family protein [Enterobacter hormaechei]HCT5176117.1 DUF3289 family protein [Enterobacter hormaechei]